MGAAKVRHWWSSLRTRTRVGFVLLAIAIPAGGWLLLVQSGDSWPARAVLKTPRDTWSLAFSPDGRTFLTSGEGGITPWDTGSGRKGPTWPIPSGDFASSGAYSPDGRTFAVGVASHPRPLAIELIDTRTGRSRATLATRHTGLYQVRFGPDGRTVRAILGNGPRPQEVVTWDASTGEVVSTRAITAPIWKGTVISPDGRTMALLGPRGVSIQLWDLEADRSLGFLADPNRTGSFGAAGFSSDGRTLAAGREDGAFDLWDVPTRTFRKTLSGHSGGFIAEAIRFSPDGRTLASTGQDRGSKRGLMQIYRDIWERFFRTPRRSHPEIIVIDVATGERIARASSSLFPMFSPDGRTIATRQADLSVRLRDLPDSSR